MAHIARVGTAVPEHKVAQTHAKDIARKMFAPLPDVERMLKVFDRSGVEQRYFAFPPEYYRTHEGFGRRNTDYIDHAADLAEEACRDAGVVPAEIDHVILVTTTGLATPSLDAHLAHRMKMRPDVRRTPIFGVGCAGGVVGLARAYDYLRAYPAHTVLLVSVELCGQTFDPEDRSKANFIASTLFGDGAAAVVLGGGAGPEIIASSTILFEDSLDVMGWDFQDRGPRLVLTKRVPSLVRDNVRAQMESFLKRNGLSLDGVRHYVIHPGGPRVIDAIHDSLGLTNGALDGSRALLRDYGNLSSASVLFILRDMMGRIQPGEHALVMAVGPGFSMDQVLIRGA